MTPLRPNPHTRLHFWINYDLKYAQFDYFGECLTMINIAHESPHFHQTLHADR